MQEATSGEVCFCRRCGGEIHTGPVIPDVLPRSVKKFFRPSKDLERLQKEKDDYKQSAQSALDHAFSVYKKEMVLTHAEALSQILKRYADWLYKRETDLYELEKKSPG